jgi:arylformamidase
MTRIGTAQNPPPHEPDERPPRVRLVELSHVSDAGMGTLPHLPGPEITTFLTREQSAGTYAPGTTFEIGRISMVANTGTYVDSPHHRFESGADLAGLPLERLAELPAVVVDCQSEPGGVSVDALDELDVDGCAVLLHTGDDARFGTPGYLEDPSFLTHDGAQWLVDHGATLVGIDAANIDDMADGRRPAHTLLLGAGVPIVEHLTGLDQLPPTRATFTAVPPRISGLGTFPVRAFASVPG